MNGPRLLYPEWLQQQAASNYPFADTASLVNSLGDHVPRDVFLDANIYAIGVTQPLFLSRVLVDFDKISLFFGDEDVIDRLSVSFNPVSPPPVLALTDAYGRAGGVIVSESVRLAVFQSWFVGEHLFDRSQTALCASCCLPLPAAGITGFILPDGSLVSGDVVFLAEQGLQFGSGYGSANVDTCVTATQQASFEVSAVGDPLFRRSLCGDLFDNPRFLQTVVFEADGRSVSCEASATNSELQIWTGTKETPDPVVRVTTSDGSLRFEMLGEQLNGAI